MKHFAALFNELDQTNKTNEKVRALVRFFEQASDEDKVWAIALFSNRRPRRTVTTTLLREWAAEQSAIPLWLFEETYHVVGDLAETISKVLPHPKQSIEKNLNEWILNIIDLKEKEEEEKKEFILQAWSSLNTDERFLFNKLITGGFRVGVSQKLITKALSTYADLDSDKIAHRLMGNWDPVIISFEELILNDNPLDDLSKPYPFYLAYALEGEVDSLGDVTNWSAEWKWDGIRGQLIRRSGNIFLWSRGEELVTDKYPEFTPLIHEHCKDFVIDGEILGYKDHKPLGFQSLQKRIGRKTVSKKLLAEVPVVMMAYDLLEIDGKDLRSNTYLQRRQQLENLIEGIPLSHDLVLLSKKEPFQTWSELSNLREESRSRKTEGFMLKRNDSIYKSGRKKGDWWKWKIEPMTIDAVMIYAMRGHGRRTNLYSDFTFAVWDEKKLVPFTKAYSGLTDIEFKEITRFVAKNTIDRFGPVRSVNPLLVFEIAFEGINESKRHKSGVALRFPRIKRWRKDKQAQEANTLNDLKSLIK